MYLGLISLLEFILIIGIKNSFAGIAGVSPLAIFTKSDVAVFSYFLLI